jgi:hypothetical protein
MNRRLALQILLASFATLTTINLWFTLHNIHGVRLLLPGIGDSPQSRALIDNTITGFEQSFWLFEGALAGACLLLALVLWFLGSYVRVRRG